jgi:hypothetical protein
MVLIAESNGAAGAVAPAGTVAPAAAVAPAASPPATVTGGPPASGAPAGSDNDQVGGMSALRGLLVYGAVLTFAGLFIDFMIVISAARHGVKPTIDATLIAAAAALSGVLGSAFALKIGVTPSPAAVNRSLAAHLNSTDRSRVAARIRQALSLEPSTTTDKSWPLTFGIWVYAIVAAATVVVYILNQHETPDSVKALAVTFSGYVLALLNMAYGLSKGSS